MFPVRLLAFSAVAGVAITVLADQSAKRNALKHVVTKGVGEHFFQLGDINYFSESLNSACEQAASDSDADGSLFPFTHIIADRPVITGSCIEDIVTRYGQEDDVFNEDFLQAIFFTSSSNTASLDASAIQYLSTLGISDLILSKAFADHASNITGSFSVIVLSTANAASLPPGPFIGKLEECGLSMSTVYRLYTDHQRAFVDGVYPASDGTRGHKSFGFFNPEWPLPSIPVPSRIYSWTDDRPLAGQRFAVKDIFNLQGIITTSGSASWTRISGPANVTAPAIQRLLDLGGVIVGKTKTTQFASAAEPWIWDDVYPPLNPRGDGWLSCSGSSAGSATAIAAYDWLDYAIGSDTGTSMRRPAAVAGVYGQRPSQGRMTLEGVTPISHSTDTAGVFCRDPYKWLKFSRLWYTPALYQDRSLTGLPAYDGPHGQGLPKKILYPVDYLPLKHPAAEDVLQGFLAKVTGALDTEIEQFNWTASFEKLSQPADFDLARLLSNLVVMWTYEQYQLVGEPLVAMYEAHHGSYPRLEPPMRDRFRSLDYSAAEHEAARDIRRRAAEAFEQQVLYSTSDICSESIVLSDISTGGLPAYREEKMNMSPNASFLAPPGTAGTSGDFCPFFGCIDVTVPLGQVTYWSKKTLREETMPVTIGLIAKRGCDLMLYDFIEKLADVGVLKTVKAGVQAF
ncbi:amidase family protein [Exophiala viscosa]|uniref:Amidase family protein n=1 Tax=Exophiala viscosa TaxID=2486360 RepID=A0AAN6IEX4_9EURO|nr:amidase family protein [Exophiala viscosa]